MRLFICAIIAFFIVLPIYFIKEARAANPKRREAEVARLKQLAVERGHVVTAKFVKIQAFSVVPAGRAHQTENICIYEYDYKGKHYTYRYRSDYPHPTLTLYFVSDPKKASVDLAIDDRKVSWPLVYVIIAAVLYLVTGG